MFFVGPSFNLFSDSAMLSLSTLGDGCIGEISFLLAFVTFVSLVLLSVDSEDIIVGMDVRRLIRSWLVGEFFRGLHQELHSGMEIKAFEFLCKEQYLQ